MKGLPGSVSGAAEAIRAARGRESQLSLVVEEGLIPMVVVDNERRYLEVNRSARLFFRKSPAEMRGLRIDDFTPSDRLGMLERTWRQMMESGFTAGSGQVATPDGGRFDQFYWGMANALPGQHVFVFAVAQIRDESTGPGDGKAPAASPLTPREIELLQLAAHGLNGPRIAQELVLSPATVRTHFEHIYRKLGVGDRAGAVAQAMRLGLIE